VTSADAEARLRAAAVRYTSVGAELEALRALKRQVSDAVFTRLQADTRRA